MTAAKVLQNVQQLKMSMIILNCNNSKIQTKILMKKMTVKIAMNKMHKRVEMRTSMRGTKNLIVN
jgi:hypothetical protein